MVAVSIALLAACSDNRSAEVSDKPAAAAVGEEAPPSSTQGVVVGKAPTAANSKSFVTLTPASTKELTPPDTKPLMDQIQMSFVPALLIVRSGYPVVFRSSDEEPHNININHARTRQQEFNIAIHPTALTNTRFALPVSTTSAATFIRLCRHKFSSPIRRTSSSPTGTAVSLLRVSSPELTH